MASTTRARPDNAPSASNSRSSSPLPPPPPPPHTHIPARLSLDLHRDGDSENPGAFDLSGVLSMMTSTDSRDGAGSSQSYEMVTPPGEQSAARGELGSDIGGTDSVVLVSGHEERSNSTPDSPLVASDSVKNHLDLQLDGSTDQPWENVSVQDSAAGATRRDSLGMERREADYNRHASSPSSPSPPPVPAHAVHPALRVPPSPEHLERPSSVAGDFFQDFDGVHCSPEAATSPPPSPAPPSDPHFDPRSSSALPQPRPISYAIPEGTASQSSLNSSRRGTQYRDPNLIYYPAPVPAVLTLPPLMTKDTKTRNRLSKVQKRASVQVLSDLVPSEDRSGTRRSIALGEEPAEPAPPKRLSHLPPALRASAFFDSMHQAPTVAPELKEASAVATLDSILDASASASPAAFTDHPITGVTSTTHLPVRNEYRNSVAITVAMHPGDSPRSSVDGGESAPPPPIEADTLPTTLLAELESRKQQQKSRNRTAASAFPSGIRSTLLELDAVAQVQAQSRRQKRTHLAWEEPDENEDSAEDEDVPLGILYQGAVAQRQLRKDDDVPLGLLVQKEMEDSEPLSRRRERLRQQRGTATPPPQIPQIPQLETEEEVEEETLAQRMKRLRDTKAKQRRMTSFGSGSLDLKFDGEEAARQSPPPEEETLAQRRKRLKEEEERKRLSHEAKAVQAEVRKRASMATILQGQYGNGVMGNLGGGMMGRSTPMLSLPQQQQQQQQQQQPGKTGLIHQAGIQMLRPQMSMGNMQMGGMNGMNNMNGMNMMRMSTMGMPPAAMGMPAMGMQAQTPAAMMTPQEIAMNNRQREMVERWRASVM